MSSAIEVDIISEGGKFATLYGVTVPALPRKGDTLSAFSRDGVLKDFEVLGVHFDGWTEDNNTYEVTVVAE